MNVLIVDNEARVRATIATLLGHFCPEVTRIDMAGSLAEARAALHLRTPDLLLLDIELDDGTGFELLHTLEGYAFQVVFITAFDQYAVDAFRLSAVDYLLKPVDPMELQQAVAKALDQQWLRQQAQALAALRTRVATRANPDQRIALRGQETIYLVRPTEIYYCQAEGAYTNILLTGGRSILVSRTLKDYDDMLVPLGFMRVHNSYLVNMQVVVGFKKVDGGYLIMENEAEIPVAQRKREAVMRYFKQF